MGSNDREDGVNSDSTWGTSATLLERVRGAEEGAWELMCRIYTPLVYGWARKAGLRETDAEDVVQDVFERIAAKLSSFRYERPGDTFRAWIWTISRNKIRDWYRDCQSQPHLATGGSHALRQLNAIPDWVSNDEECVEPTQDAASEAAFVRRALELVRGDFNEQTWQAFWRLTVEGHYAKDIARDLNMSDNAVRQAKFRVLKRLKESLG